MTMDNHRLFWRVAQIKVADIQPNDVIRLDGRWREVIDVHPAHSDPTDVFLDNSPEYRELKDKVIDGYGRIGVRYVADERSVWGRSLVNGLSVLRLVDLVDIQVPDQPMQVRDGDAR